MPRGGYVHSTNVGTTPGTGFVSIADFLNANRGTLDRERSDLAGMVGGEYDAAKAAADAVIGGARPGTDYTTTSGYLDALTKANQAQDDYALLGTTGGLTDLISRKYNASQPQAAFDASLLGSVDAQKPGSIIDYLNGGLSVATIPIPPPGLPGSSQARHDRPGGRGVYPPPPPPPEQPYVPPDEWWEGKDVNNYGGGGA